MADEITIRQFISVKSGNLVYPPSQASFQADMTGHFGPAPGATVATYEGTDVDLSAFSDPAWCHLYNQEPDDGASVSYGTYDPETERYYPLGKLEPGWHVLICLDEAFGGEFVGTGTGTDFGVNRLRIKAKDADSANVFVGIFER